MIDENGILSSLFRLRLLFLKQPLKANTNVQSILDMRYIMRVLHFLTYDVIDWIGNGTSTLQIQQ